jgi:hypothetical protein
MLVLVFVVLYAAVVGAVLHTFNRASYWRVEQRHQVELEYSVTQTWELP